VRLPVLAIGGITVVRLAEVAAAGAAGAAAIGLFALGAQAELDEIVAHARRVFRH
jgi:thiamine monophosphate synthase